MFGHKYYHETIRKYIIIFGTLFNEIFIYRTDSSGNKIQEIKVPLAYGPRDKTLARLEQDTDLDTEAGFDTSSALDDILDFTERNPFGDEDN